MIEAIEMDGWTVEMLASLMVEILALLMGRLKVERIMLLKTAHKMLADGLDPETVVKYTELSLTEVMVLMNGAR